jgi:hypothetical protein
MTQKERSKHVAISTAQINVDSIYFVLLSIIFIVVLTAPLGKYHRNVMVKMYSDRITIRKEHKIVMIGGSHSRGYAVEVKNHPENRFEVVDLIKPGVGAEILVKSVTSDIIDLAKRVVYHIQKTVHKLIISLSGRLTIIPNTNKYNKSQIGSSDLAQFSRNKVFKVFLQNIGRTKDKTNELINS